jgi:hypothetical protein
MMSGVASRCQVRYHQLMERANLLKFTAALIVFGSIVTWVALWQWTTGLGAILKRQSWLILGIPLGLTQWIAGKLTGAGVWVGQKVLWFVCAHVDLWLTKRLSAHFDGMLDRLDDYWALRRHQPRHLAA